MRHFVCYTNHVIEEVLAHWGGGGCCARNKQTNKTNKQTNTSTGRKRTSCTFQTSTEKPLPYMTARYLWLSFRLKYHHHHHHHIYFMGLGHLLTRSGLTYPDVSPKVYHNSFCQLGSSVSLPWVIYLEAFCLHVVSSFNHRQVSQILN